MGDSYVCSGAMMKCTMGTSPAVLTVLPVRTVFLAGQPQANISDHQSMVNLAPFGLCRSLAYPATASATAAALGTLTPMPCVHNTPAPWIGGKMDYLVKGQPALLKSCKCQCMWGGTISLTTDGQVGVGTQYVQKKNKQTFSNPPKEIIFSDNQPTDSSSPTNSSNSVLSHPAKDKLENFLKGKPGWFKNKGNFNNNNNVVTIDGFQSLELEKNANNNGSTNQIGTIYLNEDIMKLCLDRFQKIQNHEANNKQDQETLKKEETAMATLWHEIVHNMHDLKKDIVEVTDPTTNKKNKKLKPMGETAVKYMETVNEFVARKTLDLFFNSLGGELSNKDLMSNRTNTGYNKWVRNYDNAIAEFELDPNKVLEIVRNGLFNTPYADQKQNLINGLVKAGEGNAPDERGNHHPTEEEARQKIDTLFTDNPDRNIERG